MKKYFEMHLVLSCPTLALALLFSLLSHSSQDTTPLQNSPPMTIIKPLPRNLHQSLNFHIPQQRPTTNVASNRFAATNLNIPVFFLSVKSGTKSGISPFTGDAGGVISGLVDLTSLGNFSSHMVSRVFCRWVWRPGIAAPPPTTMAVCITFAQTSLGRRRQDRTEVVTLVSGMACLRSPSKSSVVREGIQRGTWRSCFRDTNHSIESVESLS